MESTIYCAPDARGCGVGTLLYRALLELLAACGYWNVYALVADPNPASERIHAQLGFSCVGRTPHTAYKFGWLGLSTWWLMPIRRRRKCRTTTPYPDGDGRADAGCALQIRKNRMKRNEELRQSAGALLRFGKRC